MEAKSILSPALRRGLVQRSALVVAAIALGWLGRNLFVARVAEIQSLAASDLLEARRQLAHLLEGCAVAVFGTTSAIGVAMARAGWKGIELGQFPPPGVWSWGSARQATGPGARRLARAGFVLGALVVVLSIAGGGMLWFMAEKLLACRAGVSPR